MVIGKLPVPGRSTTCNMDITRARANCACSKCGWGHLDVFLSSFLSSLEDSPI